MSEVPSTPPEISCPGDTAADSLLARLRRITGITELPPLLDEPRANIHTGAPPVDRLIPWLRDGFAAVIAVGIAVTVAAAAVAYWLWWRGGESVERMKQSQRARAERIAKAKAALVPEAAAVESAVATQNPAAGIPREKSIPVVPETGAAVPLAPAPVERTQVEAVCLEPPRQAVILPLAMDTAIEEPVTLPRPVLQFFTPLPGTPAVVAPAPRPVPVEIRDRAVARRRLRRPLVAALLLILALLSLLLLKPVRYYFTGLMGWGNAAVIVAKDGWLFPRVESEPVIAAPPPLRETAAALQAHGATLVVVSVPAKSAVYPEKLTGSASGGMKRQPHIAAAIKELTDAGARVIDLGPVLFGLKTADDAEGTVFAPQGSWWSPRGMAQGAVAAASFIQQQPGYASLPLRPALATLQSCYGRATIDDLVTALDSARMQSRYPAQSVPLIRLLTVEKKEPLAPDAASPVALLGGEPVGLYDDPALGHIADGLPEGQRSSAGFGQHLAWYLSTPMDLHVTRNGGLEAARNWLTSRPEDDRRKKKLVVWVLTDSDLMR